MWVYNSAVKAYSISNLMLSYRWLNSSASSSLCSVKMRICVITSSLATFSRCFIKGTDTDTLKINNYVHWQRGTARIHLPCCCVPCSIRYLLLAASTAAKLQQRVCCCVPCSIRSISPTGRIHGSKATAAGVGPCWNRRTDGQPTDAYRPCSTYYVGTADKQTVLQIQAFQLGPDTYYISVVLAQVHSGICL